MRRDLDERPRLVPQLSDNDSESTERDRGSKCGRKTPPPSKDPAGRAPRRLTPGRLRGLLAALHALHTHEAPPETLAAVDDALLCSNYATKVRGRFETHRRCFARFDDAAAGVDTKAIFDGVIAFLDRYEASRTFVKVPFVHGDPVFSNVLLTEDSRVKFLDMRGALGDTLTTVGDVNYDLSKVYQSLCGYDFIILDVDISPTAEANMARLRAVFDAWLADKYPHVALRDIKMIVAAHFFCIVPLHDNVHHQTQFLHYAKRLLDADNAAAAPT